MEEVDSITKMVECMMGNGPRIRCMEEVVNVLSIVLGTLYYASAKPAYEGQWIDDKFEGEGTLYNEFP